MMIIQETIARRTQAIRRNLMMIMKICDIFEFTCKFLCIPQKKKQMWQNNLLWRILKNILQQIIPFHNQYFIIFTLSIKRIHQ